MIIHLSRSWVREHKVQTDLAVEANKPDIVVMDNKEGKCLVIDIARPFDTRICETEKEILKKYQHLKRELKRIWKCNEVTIVPMIIGALGMVSTKMVKLRYWT